MFEDMIIESIRLAWIADQEHPYRGQRKKEIPSKNDVRVLLEKSFLASLKKEEERPISFSVTLLRKDEVKEEQAYSKQIIMPFFDNIPFTEHSIAKLAEAFDPRQPHLLLSKMKIMSFKSGAQCFLVLIRIVLKKFLMEFKGSHYSDQMF